MEHANAFLTNLAVVLCVAAVTTVSRFMKQRLWSYGVNPMVIPNGVPERLLSPPPGDVAGVRRIFGDRSLLVKVARFDPDKRWIQAVQALAPARVEMSAPISSPRRRPTATRCWSA